MKPSPLVTIYLPTYNRLPLLKRAVESVLSQDYAAIELLVVDDGSSDGTLDYLVKKEREDSRLSLLEKKGARGAPSSRNIAILHANGDFITGLDDDDYFQKDRISSFVDAWENDDIALFSDVISLKKSRVKRSFRKDKVAFKDLLQYNHVGNQIFTTKAFLQGALFDETLPMWQDIDCWLNILSQGGYMRCVHNATYVQDGRHELFRISNKKFREAVLAWETICRKYSLSEEERLILKSQCYNYKADRLELNYFVKTFFANVPGGLKRILPRLMLTHLRSRYR